MPRRVSLSPFYLIQNRTDFSVPVQSNSHAKLCNRPRKALHLPTQSFASAHAKLCIRQRKALPSFRSVPCFSTEPLSTLLRLQRDHHLHEITQGVATLYPGLCAFALCLSFAFPLPFLSAGDLWFSATIIDTNFRIRIFNFCTSNCTPYLLIRQGGRVT